MEKFDDFSSNFSIKAKASLLQSRLGKNIIRNILIKTQTGNPVLSPFSVFQHILISHRHRKPSTFYFLDIAHGHSFEQLTTFGK